MDTLPPENIVANHFFYYMGPFGFSLNTSTVKTFQLQSFFSHCSEFHHSISKKTVKCSIATFPVWKKKITNKSLENFQHNSIPLGMVRKT